MASSASAPAAGVVLTAAQLAAQLGAYEAQLAQVRVLAVADPSDVELAALVKGLTAVTDKTRELLVAARKAEATPAPAAAAVAAPKPDTVASTAAVTQANTTTATTTAAATATATPVEDTSAEGAAGAAGEAVDTDNCKPGTRVEVSYMEGKQWFPAIVGNTNAEGNVAITLYVGDRTDTVAKSRIRTLTQPKNRVKPAEVTPGLLCQAKYAQDGKWYTARVNSVNNQRITVTFPAYGNTEVVPPEYLRHQPQTSATTTTTTTAGGSASTTSAASSGGAAGASGGSGGAKAAAATPFVLPEELVPQETDSPEEVARKRKKIKALKSKHRFKRLETERIVKQNTWTNFRQKSKKKKRRGFMTNMKKKSIFATGDSYTAKVGVTGSGRGMTEYHAPKKKVRLLGPDGGAS